MKFITYENEKQLFEERGYQLPQYDRNLVRKKTAQSPTWLHFGCGNLFRAFTATILDDLLNSGDYDQGIIAVEGYDDELIDKAYIPYDGLSLNVIMKADGTICKRVVGSITETLTCAKQRQEDIKRIKEVFIQPSLQVVSLTITEKGYSILNADTSYHKQIMPDHLMGKITYLLLERYYKGAYPIALVSMDNCAHNGDLLKQAICYFAKQWIKQGHAPSDFLDYLNDTSKVAFPLSMIDKITPRPDEKVKALLEQDDFTDTQFILTKKQTYTAPFVNAEEAQYLVIEDHFPNGRPPLQAKGVYFTNRETVEKVERMKVCTCLNPLHTALAIFGCLLGFHTISEAMKDSDLSELVTKLGYLEGLPVVTDPGIIAPKTFIDEVLHQRLINPFLPDTPQRIATDTSQKLSIRFGETLKAYVKLGRNLSELRYIPVVLAGYLRYLTGVNDSGETFVLSSDPLLEELMQIMAPFAGGKKHADLLSLKPLLQRTDIFGVDLIEIGLAQQIINLFNEMNDGKGTVRKMLKEIRLYQ